MNSKRFYVYKITNLVNYKIYVGKTGRNPPELRFKEHICNAQSGKNNYLIDKAIRKYGVDNFIFEVLEEFSTETESFYYETWWIDFLGSHSSSNKGYNLTYGGEGSSGRNMSEKSKKRASISLKKRYEKYGHPWKGKKHKQSTKDKLRAINIAKPSTIKLTAEKVIDIINDYANNNFTIKMLEKKYNISDTQIGAIFNLKKWTHLHTIPEVWNNLQKIQELLNKSKPNMSNRKLTNEQIIELIYDYKTTSISQASLARRYNVVHYCIFRILKKYCLNDKNQLFFIQKDGTKIKL